MAAMPATSAERQSLCRAQPAHRGPTCTTTRGSLRAVFLTLLIRKYLDLE